jgi:hypothetical protein
MILNGPSELRRLIRRRLQGGRDGDSDSEDDNYNIPPRRGCHEPGDDEPYDHDPVDLYDEFGVEKQRELAERGNELDGVDPFSRRGPLRRLIDGTAEREQERRRIEQGSEAHTSSVATPSEPAPSVTASRTTASSATAPTDSGGGRAEAFRNRSGGQRKRPPHTQRSRNIR